MQNTLPPLQVTILTGFLGSGKTTLINYLLKHNDGEKIAIVENEFGEANVDSALLDVSSDMEIIELSNGCVCCSIRGELTKSLQELIEKIDNKIIKVDRLILETTGLADPAPIIQAFFVDEIIRERVVLDAVVTLVDTKHILKQLDEHRVAASQIGFADRIILTKADLVDDKTKEDVLSRIHTINKKADIFEAFEGKIAKKIWINIGAFELSDELQVTKGFYKTTDLNELKFTSFSKEVPKSYSDDIKSHSFEAGALDIKKIGSLMEELIEVYGNDMLRYKGVLSIANKDKRLIIQGVHKVAGFDYGSAWRNDEIRKSIFVIIGRNIPFEMIEKRFLDCAI
ncbi:MAG: CobW family GTP-binding protein [Campylobacteraceae bacterium]